MDTEQFTVQLAAADALPVVFFGAAAGALGRKLGSAPFFAGAGVCFLSGTGKVLWKLILARKGTDVAFLGAQLRYAMPAGFALMIAGAALSDRALARELLRAALRLPSAALFAAASAGLAGMVLCARKFDRHDVRGNWIEQTINAAAQACTMIGVLLL